MFTPARLATSPIRMPTPLCGPVPGYGCQVARWRLLTSRLTVERRHDADHEEQPGDDARSGVTGLPARSSSTPSPLPRKRPRLNATSVHFTPGARTAWHTHPNGQTIWVTEGDRPLPAARRPGRGDPSRRPRLLRARRGALARRGGDAVHDAPGAGRSRRRGPSGDVGRARHRRGVRGSTAGRLTLGGFGAKQSSAAGALLAR